MIKAVIIDDESNGIKNLKNLLTRYCEEVEVIAEADSISSGLALFNNPAIQPDVAFLDINLSDGLVFQLLNQLGAKAKFDIIFVTAYEKFAIRACQYSSIGFITKPIDPDKLKEAVSRIRTGPENRIDRRMEVFDQYYSNPNAFEKMSISAIDGIYFINIKDIIRCEAEDNYTHLHLKTGKKITVSKTIKWYEELLSGVNFYRVHKSHLVNLNYMSKFVKGDGGYLIMDDGKEIEVSRRRRPAFMVQIGKLQKSISLE